MTFLLKCVVRIRKLQFRSSPLNILLTWRPCVIRFGQLNRLARTRFHMRNCNNSIYWRSMNYWLFCVFAPNFTRSDVTWNLCFWLGEGAGCVRANLPTWRWSADAAASNQGQSSGWLFIHFMQHTKRARCDLTLKTNSPRLSGMWSLFRLILREHGKAISLKTMSMHQNTHVRRNPQSLSCVCRMSTIGTRG